MPVWLTLLETFFATASATAVAGAMTEIGQDAAKKLMKLVEKLVGSHAQSKHDADKYFQAEVEGDAEFDRISELVEKLEKKNASLENQITTLLVENHKLKSKKGSDGKKKSPSRKQKRQTRRGPQSAA